MSEINMNITDDLFEALPEEEKNSEFIAVALKTFAKDAWDRFRKNPDSFRTTWKTDADTAMQTIPGTLITVPTAGKSSFRITSATALHSGPGLLARVISMIFGRSPGSVPSETTECRQGSFSGKCSTSISANGGIAAAVTKGSFTTVSRIFSTTGRTRMRKKIT